MFSFDDLCRNQADRETLTDLLKRSGRSLDELMIECRRLHAWMWDHISKRKRVVVRNSFLKRQHGLWVDGPQHPGSDREALSLYCHVHEYMTKNEGWALSVLDWDDNPTASYPFCEFQTVREAQQWFTLAKRHKASLTTQDKLASDVRRAMGDETAAVEMLTHAHNERRP
jgi:hypothetical protein